MSAKKLLKAKKPSEGDKAIKAKRTGYRFKTEGNPKLHKKDGDLNAKGKELYYKKPTAKEIQEFKRDKDGNYASDIKQIYHERRSDRKHSDDNLTKKYAKGGSIYDLKKVKSHNEFLNLIKELEGKIRLVSNENYKDNDSPYSKEYVSDGDVINVKIEKHTEKGKPTYYTWKWSEQYGKGGGVKQNPAQSESYSPKKDKKEKAKPVGKRFTNELAEKLGKSKNATPTKKEVEEYLGNGVYDEKRKDKSDVSLTKKYEEGGEAKDIEMSVEEMKVILGREPKYPNDFINGKKYKKCFLRPYYKLVD